MRILLLLFLFHEILTLDVYFVRHGARSPLVVPMKDVFGVGLQQLTEGGKIQSYYYGKELKNRHNISKDHLIIYSTPYSRTRATAEYFLKGWLGIHKRGETEFKADPKYLPPCKLSITPYKQSHNVDEQQYEDLVDDIPYVESRSNRVYKKYKISDERSTFILEKRVEASTELCQKFQKNIPGSCPTQSLNQFFNFVDIINCLSSINKTVPGVKRSEMQLPLDIVNENYEAMFKARTFPTRGVQQDLSLIQKLYEQNPKKVVIMFTHDTQMFYILRSLLGVKEVFQMFGGNMVMSFLSCLHFKLENGVAKMYFNDVEFTIKKCGKQCLISHLFEIMNT